MYTLMVVDDEENVRDGLIHYFPWTEYDIQVVAQASDGDEALDLICNKNVLPDILITDVVMSRVNGIELVQQVRKIHPNIFVIFISGYDDIEYLHSALCSKAENYILKPLNLKELQTTVKNILIQLQKRKEKQKEFELMEKKIYKSFPLIQEKFINNLLEVGCLNAGTIEQELDFLGLSYSLSNAICVLAIRLQVQENLFANPKEKYLLDFAIKNIVQELILQTFYGHIIQTQSDHFAVILTLTDSQEISAVETFANKVQETLLEVLEISVYIGIGAIETNLLTAQKSYQKSLLALQKSFFNDDRIYVYEQDTTEEKYLDIKYYVKKLDDLEIFLKEKNYQKSFQFLNNCIDALIDLNLIEEQDIKNYCCQIIYTLTAFLNHANLLSAKDYTKQTDTICNIYRQRNIASLKQITLEYLDFVFNYLNHTDGQVGIVTQIKKYLNDHYKEKISLQDISDDLHIATSHMCAVFKKKTGKTIIDYLSQIRIYKAMDLLKKNNILVSDICYEVGYTDPGYFSKAFKKYIGISPSEYRINSIGTEINDEEI